MDESALRNCATVRNTGNIVITIIIPTPNKDIETTFKCVASLYNSNTEIRLAPWAGSFAQTVNLASSGITTPFMGVVNNDTVAPPEWMQLMNHQDKKIGIVCPLESDKPGFSAGGEVYEGPGMFFGGFWIMPTHVWEEMNGLDERYYPYYCEDTDLLYRLEKAGYKIYQDHRVRVKHLQNHTIKNDPQRMEHLRRNALKFAMRHGINPISYQAHGIPQS